MRKRSEKIQRQIILKLSSQSKKKIKKNKERTSTGSLRNKLSNTPQKFQKGGKKDRKPFEEITKQELSSALWLMRSVCCMSLHKRGPEQSNMIASPQECLRKRAGGRRDALIDASEHEGPLTTGTKYVAPTVPQPQINSILNQEGHHVVENVYTGGPRHPH